MMVNDERIDCEEAGDVGIEISISLSFPDSPSEKAVPPAAPQVQELPVIDPKQREAAEDEDIVPEETRDDKVTSPSPTLEPQLTLPEEDKAPIVPVREELEVAAELPKVSKAREEEKANPPEPEQTQIEEPQQPEPEQLPTKETETVEPSPKQPEEKEIMPPAPFVHPTSPSLGDEAGMEAMWVEELVTPSPTSEAEAPTTTNSKPRRGSNFFSHARLFKRHAKEEKRVVVEKPKKLHTSVKLLGDEEDPQLQTPPSQKRSAKKREGRAPSVRVQVQTGTRRPPAAVAAPTPHQQSKTKISRQIAQKATNARELLAMALHPETDTDKKHGLAQAAFGEATNARLLMEGDNPPKGLDLVLRAASHKGRSAVLAASLCPDSQEQVSRAKHYMDLILPVKTFPAVSTDHVAPVKGDSSISKASEAELSSLGFCSPRPAPQATPAGTQAKDVTSPISMSSLNEILDGPVEVDSGLEGEAPPERAAGQTKSRIAFMRNFSPNTKNGNQNITTNEMHYNEMLPPDDAASMDEHGSWTDGSYEEGRTPVMEARSSKRSGEKKTRKKKRVFRLARMAGLRGQGGSANDSKSSADKLGWLRRKSEKDFETSSIPVVDMTPPPNVPYQTHKSYQRFEASVQLENGSRRSGNTKELSTIVRRTHQVDKETQDRLQAALLSDETEQLLSFDGVRMFGQNIKEKENEDDEIFDPLEEGVAAGEFLTKRAVKIDPQFVAAPAGRASKLTAKSWDSLVEGGAARLADAPKAIVQALLTNETEDEEIPPPYPSPNDSEPPLYVPSASPMSVESRVPGLTDKYSSAEEPALEDKYSTEELFSDDAVVSPSSGARSPSSAEESPKGRRLGAALLARMQPRRKSRETRDEKEHLQGESLPEDRNFLEDEPKLIETPMTNKEEQMLISVETPRPNVEEPKPLETPKSASKEQKPRLKMKIMQKFQRRKKNKEDDHHDEQEEPEQENFPVEEIQYKEVYYGDLGPQETGTTTLTSVDHENNVPEVKIEGNLMQEMEAKPTTSTEESDPLIRNIKKQAKMPLKRGKDPVTRNEVYVARGIDP